MDRKAFRGYKSGVMKQDPMKYTPLFEEDNESSVMLVPAEGDVEFVQLNQNT